MAPGAQAESAGCTCRSPQRGIGRNPAALFFALSAGPAPAAPRRGEDAPLTETQQGLPAPTHRPARAVRITPSCRRRANVPAGWMGARAAAPRSQPDRAAGRVVAGGERQSLAGHNRHSAEADRTRPGAAGHRAAEGSRSARSKRFLPDQANAGQRLRAGVVLTRSDEWRARSGSGGPVGRKPGQAGRGRRHLAPAFRSFRCRRGTASAWPSAVAPARSPQPAIRSSTQSGAARAAARQSNAKHPSTDRRAGLKNRCERPLGRKLRKISGAVLLRRIGSGCDHPLPACRNEAARFLGRTAWFWRWQGIDCHWRQLGNPQA